MNDLVRHEDADQQDVEDDELGALLAALSPHDLGDPTEEFDMATLTPAERKALLRLLRTRLGMGAGSENEEEEGGMSGGTEAT